VGVTEGITMIAIKRRVRDLLNMVVSSCVRYATTSTWFSRLRLMSREGGVRLHTTGMEWLTLYSWTQWMLQGAKRGTKGDSGECGVKTQGALRGA